MTVASKCSALFQFTAVIVLVILCSHIVYPYAALTQPHCFCLTAVGVDPSVMPPAQCNEVVKGIPATAQDVVNITDDGSDVAAHHLALIKAMLVPLVNSLPGGGVDFNPRYTLLAPSRDALFTA